MTLELNGKAPPASAPVDINRVEGTSRADLLKGTAGVDVIDALAGNDQIDGGPGSDRIDGGTGNDEALYPGSRTDQLLSRDSNGVVRVADRFGTQDTLVAVEALRFGGDPVATAGLPYQPMVSDPPVDTGPGVHPVYRFYNARDHAYFYTPIPAERDLVLRESTDPAYTPENGVWPYFYQGATFASAPTFWSAVAVYRFYNTQTGHHFFTASLAEAQMVERESSDPTYTPENGLWPFVHEGVGFFAYADEGHAATVPVLRFYSPSLNRHFFTASPDEAQQMRLTGQWTDEGVAFWGFALEGNHPPTLILPHDEPTAVRFSQGQPGSYQFPNFLFYDADGDPLSYSARLVNGDSLPVWLSFSPGARLFSGTPPIDSGAVAVRVTASDGRGGTTSGDIVITSYADDLAASTATSGTIQVGGSTMGTIDYPQDRDWFRVSVVAGHLYRATVGPPDPRPLATAVAYAHLGGLSDAAGREVKDGLSFEPGSKLYPSHHMQMDFRPVVSGDYYIAVLADDERTGAYQLSLSLVSGTMVALSASAPPGAGDATTGDATAPADTRAAEAAELTGLLQPDAAAVSWDLHALLGAPP